MNEKKKERDPRYIVVQQLFRTGKLSSFPQFFKHLPKTVLSEYLGINNNRMQNMIDDPRHFRVEEVFKVADYYGIDVDDFSKLLGKEIKRVKSLLPPPRV